MAKPQTSPRLSAQDILSHVSDLKWEDVEVPDWGGVVRVAGLTGDERDSLEQSVIKYKREKVNGKTKITREEIMRGFRGKLLVRSLVEVGPDDDHPIGARMFSDAQAEALGAMPAVTINPLFAKAQELSGLTDENVEELTAELGNDQSGAGGSG